MEEPLINGRFLLEKFTGKGGWTYALIPNEGKFKRSGLNWVKVKGTIDAYEIKNFSLLPMGNGKLFLPVKAAIRKSISKEQGDYVQITLYPEVPVADVSQELLICLEDEPQAKKVYLDFNEADRIAYTSWIEAARTDDMKVERIAKTIDLLAKGMRLPATVK